MGKRFDIHDWQAKQRLTEDQRSMSNADIRALQTVISNYSLNKVLNTLAVIVDKIGKHDEADMVQKLANQIQDFSDTMDKYEKRYGMPSSGEVEEKIDEHHGDDFPKGLLKKSVNSFLGQLKKKSEIDYDKVEDIMKKHFNIDEMSTTGTGASFQAGSGEGYMTPNAFKKKNKKN